MSLAPENEGPWICSHNKCEERLPNSHLGQEIPPGWTVGRIEEHGTNTVKRYYIYLCPRHIIATADRQGRLF